MKKFLLIPIALALFGCPSKEKEQPAAPATETPAPADPQPAEKKPEGKKI